MLGQAQGIGHRLVLDDGELHRVAVLPPAFDHDLGIGARAQPLQAQGLVARLAVEALSLLPTTPKLKAEAPGSRDFRTPLAGLCLGPGV
jgi:hypothetical protein